MNSPRRNLPLKTFNSNFLFSVLGRNKTGSTSKARSKEFKSSSVKRKQYSTAEISSLEAIFKSSKGHPSANIIQRTAESLEIGEQQVNNYSLSCRPVFKYPNTNDNYVRLPFDLYLTTFLSLSRYHPALFLCVSSCEWRANIHEILSGSTDFRVIPQAMLCTDFSNASIDDIPVRLFSLRLV